MSTKRGQAQLQISGSVRASAEGAGSTAAASLPQCDYGFRKPHTIFDTRRSSRICPAPQVHHRVTNSRFGTSLLGGYTLPDGFTAADSNLGVCSRCWA